jgi:peptidoglycan/LPS O-acetylase OafA/YrhL
MPRPAESKRPYVPGLDGIRALAVICVIGYHLGVPGLQGGMLGVGVFFTLSGYLITDLLLEHWRRDASLGLARFWQRRARRLLPALFVLLIVVSVWTALADPSQLAGTRRQVFGAIVYANNWVTIAQHGSYFARFSAPLPLDHLWSLSIEEQFYLVWPWLLLLGIWTARGRARLAALVVLLAIGSAVVMAVSYHPGYDPTRAYEGTDTRAFALLIGAVLAIVLPSRSSRRTRGPRASRALEAGGVLGLLGIGLLVWRTDTFSSFLYPWGFLLLSLATCAVIAAVAGPRGRLGVLLGVAPLRWIGVRSYGIYLWQWPVIVLIHPRQAALPWQTAVLAVAITVVAAALSWRYVEDPIRHGATGRLWRRVQAANAGRSRRILIAAAAPVAVLCVPALALAGVFGHRVPAPPALASASEPTTQNVAQPVQRVASTRRLPTKSSCRSVVYIGDSTSAGEISTNYIPNPSQRIDAQLARVGVTETLPEISAARSIVETFQGHPNAATIAQQHIVDGYRGCWILALGTNEAANVATGSNVGFSARIARMMSIIGRHPVLWIDAMTLVGSGPYAESGMQDWNRALAQSCSRYPTMRVFDWPAYARSRWFIPDGIHYYTPGYIARSRLIAHALAHAFPVSGAASSSCVVR